MFNFFKKPQAINQLVGVCLTDDGVALAAVTRDNDQAFHLTHYAYAACDSIDAMQQTVAKWTKEFNLKGQHTNFVLGPHMFSFILTEAPEVKPEELAAAMRWKIKDVIQYDLTDAVVDAFNIPGQKERGRQPMAYAVCAATDVLRAYVTLIGQSQLCLNAIDIPPMVQRNIAQLLPEEKSGVALLALGKAHGLITVCRNGVLYLARDLDVGWGHFELQANPQAGSSGLALDGDAPANQRVFDTIILEVQRSLDYYESHFAQPPIQSLVIAPLPQTIPGMLTYIASNLGIQVRELDLNPLIEPEVLMERHLQALCLPAIGAALRWPSAA